MWKNHFYHHRWLTITSFDRFSFDRFNGFNIFMMSISLIKKYCFYRIYSCHNPFFLNHTFYFKIFLLFLLRQFISLSSREIKHLIIRINFKIIQRKAKIKFMSGKNNLKNIHVKYELF